MEKSTGRSASGGGSSSNVNGSGARRSGAAAGKCAGGLMDGARLRSLEPRAVSAGVRVCPGPAHGGLDRNPVAGDPLKKEIKLSAHAAVAAASPSRSVQSTDRPNCGAINKSYLLLVTGGAPRWRHVPAPARDGCGVVGWDTEFPRRPSPSLPPGNVTVWVKICLHCHP